MAEKDVNIKEQAKGKLNQDLKDYMHELRLKSSRDYDNREEWRNKLINASNQRMGVARASNYPYENAPDIPLPETDKIIKKSTPNLVLSSWNARKICQVNVEKGTRENPQMKQQVHYTGECMNLVLREKMDLYDKLELAADYAKEKGHAIYKVVEDFKDRQVHKVLDLNDYPDHIIDQLKKAKNTELKQFIGQRFQLDPEDDEEKKVIGDVIDQFRSGKEVIEFDIEDVSSLPNIEVPLPENICVPDYTTDIEYAERITEEFFLTRTELEKRMEQGIYEDKDLDEYPFKDENKDDDNLTANKRQQEGTSAADKDDLYRIHEISCWYKPEDRWERWVFTFLAEVNDAERGHLRHIPFPFEFEGWNYYRFDNERRDPRHHSSRGEPERIRALQEIMERSINNMLIRDEHNNNPVYEVLDTSELIDREKTFAPGELVPVSALGQTVARLDDARNVDMSGERILQLVKAHIEEYVGSTDQLFRNATNKGGEKTLGETQQGIESVQPLINKEVIRWNETLSKVFKAVFEIMKERLGDSIFIEGTPVTREMFNFPAEVKANGTLEVADKRLATQKALARMQMAMQLLEIGVTNQEDVYNAYKDYLEKDGVKDPEDFSTHPQQIAQTQLAQIQQQIQQGTQQFKALQEKIKDGWKELAKNKEKMKELKAEFEGELEALEEVDAVKELLGSKEKDEGGGQKKKSSSETKSKAKSSKKG